MNKYKKIFEIIWKYLPITLIISLLIFGGIQCNRIKNLERKLFKHEQNIIALNDSLKFERKKSGELLISIAGYITTEKELKTLNKDLWDRVQGQDGKILSLNHVIVQLIQDTAELRKYLVEKDKIIQKLLKIDDNTYAAPWSITYKYDSTNFDIFSGKTFISVINKNPLELAHIDTEIIKRITQIDLTWGQKIENKSLRIFIESKYPGFTVKQMEGVLIDPNSNSDIQKLIKKKHFFTGVSIGLGATAGFNITSGKYGLVVGPSIVYNIYTW